MEVDNNCLSNLDENTEDNQMERSTPGSEQVTESGTPSDFSEVWNDFKCVFCSQDLKHMSNPKLLPCLHTACESCLTSEANSESSPSSSGTESSVSYLQGHKIKKIKDKKKGVKYTKTGVSSRFTKFPNGAVKQQIQCPACSQEVNLDDAVDHLFLMEYAQSSESLPEESSYPCTSCEEGNEGTAFCQDCQEWLCETCVNAHHRVRVTKDHIVRPKEEMEGENSAMRNQKYLLCPVHPNERLKVYCETCDKLTCRDCQLSDHKAHKYQFLRNACDEEKDNITELLAKIKEKQGHMEEASNSLNKRHDEIVDREGQISQDIQLFGVKFITDINKRAKALLQDLNKVCTDKKNLINQKSQELKSLAERLKHCQKFAEAAMALGSETALVYSKKPIMNQLRRILRHKCDVPNPHHVVDIQFTYETNFLSQYISNLGQILVDQQPLPGASANANAMLPMPQNISQSPVPSTPPVRQVPQMPVNQRATIPPVQQISQQQQQQQLGPYGQPQVTSSTDMVRNNNPQMRQMMNNQMNYGRPNHVQRGPVPNQQGNFQMQANPTYTPRQMVHQQNPQTQMRQRPQVQQPQQQQQQMQQAPPPYNNAQLPMPLRQNKNISVTTLPSPSGPSPSKQRAIAPRSNMTMTNQGNSIQRMNSNQVNQIRQNQPQLIVLDGENNQKTPNMSNTTRLTHFPSNLAATLAANPSLQIQPANNNNFQNTQPVVPQISLLPYGQTMSSMLAQSSPNLVQQLIQPASMSGSQSICITSVPMQNYSNVNMPGLSATSTASSSNKASFKLIMPKQNVPTPSLNSPVVSTNVSSESVIQNSNLLKSDPTGDTNTPYLKHLLSEQGDAPSANREESKSPDSSSSESLPSLDSLLNLPNFQNITATATLTDDQKASSQTDESACTNSRSTDSNSPHGSVELSSAFQKSCRTNDDKCTVCKESKDLIHCTSCARIYHGTCHVPLINNIKSLRSDWVCMMCKDVLTCPVPDEDTKKKLLDLQGRELMICERILLEVFLHPQSWFFHNRVSRKVPNYYKVIKRPMDLSTIRTKLSPTHFEHYVDVEAFIYDMRLIFENCFIFNSVGSDVYNAGKEVRMFFEGIMSNYFPELTESEDV